MSNGPDGPIIISPVFSRWLALYLMGIHLAALFLLLPLQLPILSSFALVVGICTSLAYYWKRDLLHRGRGSISSVKWSANRGWLISADGGKELPATLSPTSFLSRYLVLLCFKTANNSRRRLLLPGDAIDPDLLRKLKVLLRMRDHFGV